MSDSLKQRNPKKPAEISWNSKRKQGSKFYRGANANNTEVGGLAGMQHSQAIHYNQKNTNMILENTGNLGQPLEFNFNFNQNSFQKKDAPMISVVQSTNVLITNNNNDNNIAPEWDGFQPINCHFSKLKPKELIDCVEIVLNKLIEECSIDYFRESPFIIVGRTYSKTTDAEFRITVFRSNDNNSVLECRRSSGETFCYCNCEQKLINLLKKNNSINVERMYDDNNNINNNEMMENDFDSLLSQSSLSTDSLFSFGSLPPLPLDLDANNYDSDTDNEQEEKKQKQKNNTETVSMEEVQNAVDKAIDSQSFQDFLRNDILILKELISKYSDKIKAVKNIISKISDAITDDIFDCFAIKTYLEIISELIDIGCEIPANLNKKIIYIQERWSKNVVNEITPSVKFSFHRSQQIQRCCQEVLNRM